MDSNIKKYCKRDSTIGFIFSFLLHLLVTMLLAYPFLFEITNISFSDNYVQVLTQDFSSVGNAGVDKVKKNNDLFKESILNKGNNKSLSTEINKYDFIQGFKNSDTANLLQIYTETSLNVAIKYPIGWKFFDQNVKNKLDGVTFLGLPTLNNNVPYIHLEVADKYLFNPKKFKFKININNFDAYFNEPEEIENQYSQSVYIRTESSEDYIIKLVINEKESFEEFQPVFFGMIKSFSFGKSIF